ncbi:MAG: TylF/MycF family methyltransferase [Patescibacteria group bacterium]|nr:TylF/MycF family methyltransferase [Patescibacteria group bacterium]
MSKIDTIYNYLYEIAKKFKLTEQELPAEAVAREAMHKAILARFFDPAVGKVYGLDLAQKKELVEQFKTITTKVQTATHWIYYVAMATVVFNIPKSQKGDLIECGCWKGGSTAILSLVASKVKRKLYVADSFEGIPPDDDKKGHFYTHLSVLGYYEKGMYDGTLTEVKKNIKEHGNIKACQFIKGFYKDSLKKFNKPLVFAFLDVDLRSSLEDSVKYIWPNLLDNSLIYTDDSCDMDVVKFWFDEDWWQKTLKIKAPGYVGSGCGLPINPDFSSLGYARKIADPGRIFKREDWFHGKEIK